MNRTLGPFRAAAPRRHTAIFSLTPIVFAVAFLFGGCGGSGHHIPATDPVLVLSTGSVPFVAIQGSAANPAPVSADVTNTGTGTLSFTAASDSPWLFVTPGGGTAPQDLQISVAVGNLLPNTYVGHVTVTDPVAQDSPAVITVTFTVGAQAASNTPFWAQWGSNPQHSGMVSAAGQSLSNTLANIPYDPFVEMEKNENVLLFGEAVLTVHEQAPLVDGNDTYMVMKAGSYTSCTPAGTWATGSQCGPNTWNTMVWEEVRYSWVSGLLVPAWTFPSDWVPEPNSANINQSSASFPGGFLGLEGWEPVFHPVDANNFIYVPGAAGTVWKVDKNTGLSASHINPFTANADVTAANTFVSGPLTADANGNIYYNVIELNNAGNPWNQNDVVNSWLVKITPDDTPLSATFASLTPGAPVGTSLTCPGTFFNLDTGNVFPWPPAPDAVAPAFPGACGSQRPGINVAPAISADGNTVYTVSRAHFDSMVVYLLAVNTADLTPQWQASLQNRLQDGCGFLLPIAASGVTNLPNSCLFGTTPGVDPTTNTPGSGMVIDQASSSPTVLPDGSVAFGAVDNYNFSRGHLFRFDSLGNYVGAFGFGWDSTPGVWSHDNTFSVVIKDNHYPSTAYCNDPSSQVCTFTEPGPYYITQLDANFNTEWSFQSTNDDQDHPNGFEWCINMPAIDSQGNVYVNSEDGNAYELPQSFSGIFTTPSGKIFLDSAIGAAYTPLSIGPDGKLYSQNNGRLFVLGN